MSERSARPSRPGRAAAIGAAAVAAAALTGCVDRRIHITSDPPGALVTLNDVEMGRTPAEVDFTYFGTYDVVLRLEGYEPLVTTGVAEAPPHEWPGLDLVFLAMPFRKTTRIDWHYVLEPSGNGQEGLMERAAALREQALAADEAGAPTNDPNEAEAPTAAP